MTTVQANPTKHMRRRWFSAMTALVIAVTLPPPAHADQHLRYFGYVGVDCQYDDPYDATRKKTYVDEVRGFTNLNNTCVYDPAVDLTGRLRAMAASGMRSLLNVQGVFFSHLDKVKAAERRLVVLYPDYVQRWQRFVRTNSAVLDSAHVGSIYLVDEPYNAGIPYAELRAVADLVKGTFPTIPVSFVEAWSRLDVLRVPPSVDWIGFDHYQVRDPARSDVYRAMLETLKSRRSTAAQKILIVLDAHWTPGHLASAHGSARPRAMGAVARSYYELARSEPDVVAMIGYAWVGGIDAVSLGTRQLPSAVKAEHRRIGQAIVGS